MSNKLIIILIGVMMLLVLGLGGGLFMMWNKLSAVEARTQPEVPDDEPAVEEAPVPIEKLLGPIVSLETFIVNLADQGGKRYLRMTIDLELDSEDLEPEINKRLPQVRDSILTILPTKRFEDISSASGKTALRDQMLERINSFLANGRVTNIYFKEFVVQ